MVRHVVPFMDRNYRHNACARIELPHAFTIGVIKCSENKSSKIKHNYTESGDLVESCAIAFDSNDWWNLP